MAASRADAKASAALAGLTPRELEVLRHIARGRTNARVAEQLGVSVYAVKFHLASVFRKLGVGNRTEAAMMYHRTIAADDSQHGETL